MQRTKFSLVSQFQASAVILNPWMIYPRIINGNTVALADYFFRGGGVAVVVTWVRLTLYQVDSVVFLSTLDSLGSDLLSGLCSHPLNSWLGPDVCIRPIPLLYYTRTIPQRPPSRQRKRGCCREALDRWPLWRGRGVIWHLCFFSGV